MKKVILVFVVILLGASSLAFGQEFGESSTTDSYTEQFDGVRTPSFFASEIRKALSFNGFRQVRETGEAVFMSKPLQTNSGYLQNYDAATVWVRSDSTVRVHIWRKRSNLREGYYRAWNMPEDGVVNYRRVLNEYFQSN